MFSWLRATGGSVMCYDWLSLVCQDGMYPTPLSMLQPEKVHLQGRHNIEMLRANVNDNTPTAPDLTRPHPTLKNKFQANGWEDPRLKYSLLSPAHCKCFVFTWCSWCVPLMFAQAGKHTHIYICTYTYTYVYIYVCMYMCKYIRM